MTALEFNSILFSIFCFAGALANYNLVYSKINAVREWRWVIHFNRPFYGPYNLLGKWFYVLAVFWYACWAAAFNDKELWFAASLVDIYFFTRVAAWFVLGRHAQFVKKHTALKQLGPDGSIEPPPLPETP